MAATADAAFRDATDQSRFELEVDGEVAFADYDRQEGNLLVQYVYAPPVLRGTGAADRLMREIAEQARSEGLKIVPICGYASAWLRRHKAYRDLIAA